MWFLSQIFKCMFPGQQLHTVVHLLSTPATVVWTVSSGHPKVSTIFTFINTSPRLFWSSFWNRWISRFQGTRDSHMCGYCELIHYSSPSISAAGWPPGVRLNKSDYVIARPSVLQVTSWVALPSLVIPHRWRLHISPLYDVLDHTNQIFSESLWHPLSTDSLTTHPSPTQTHQTHQTHPEPSRPDHFSTLWHSAVFKPYIFWNLMTSTIHWPIALTTSPSPTQTHHYMEQPNLLSLAQLYNV